VIGAILVNYAKTWLTGQFPEIWLFALGALFVAVTLFLPRGIVGLAVQLFSRRKPSAPKDSPTSMSPAAASGEAPS
jgi:urea transport system permease protein